MRSLPRLAAGIFGLLSACSVAHAPPHTGRSDLKSTAAALYRQYEAALTTPKRDALAGFYHPSGAVRVLNGTRRVMTRAELDSVYRGPWNPPEYFAWEDLAYDSIGPAQVVVTGGFRWKGRGSSDTVRFLYSALLEAVDSGMAIRVEQETARPPR